MPFDDIRQIFVKGLYLNPFLFTIDEGIFPPKGVQFQTWEAPPVQVPTVETALEIGVEPVKEIQKSAQVEVTVATDQPSELASDDSAMIDFFDRYRAEVLNGLLILPIPSGATQWELARAIGVYQTNVSIVCQQLGYFTAPNTALPSHIIHNVCGYFRCVSNIIPRWATESQPKSILRSNENRP